ncbi:hypothetical protein CXG81DRAFT_8737 [Caulochytrium protostelioides]|uniref:2Fe-2S ferredoxin-type domain-containing protein n=1 Tax=Caulochytrium protostelioides TaxID=1555241 RepID=A0A4V1IVH4_9FUNG|nr:hypothetical protein CXG81DRAFT_8737 [Caulochytrium protostelioides]|eukprot:RKP04069.1 hypothetical protein CXG81DRAFT_8737 [Caulochytrium protostelioides]
MRRAAGAAVRVAERRAAAPRRTAALLPRTGAWRPRPAAVPWRSFSATPAAAHGNLHQCKPGEEITIHFVMPSGETIAVDGAPGDNLLELAHANDIDLEGACEGSIACSTCHVILEPEVFDALEEPTDEENDMLDLAFGLTETSRLGCQINLTPDLQGMKVRIPSATRNVQSEKMQNT